MNKTDSILASTLQKAVAAAEQTGQFFADQLPDVVNQFLAYRFIEAVTILVLVIIGSITAWKISSKMMLKTEDMITKHTAEGYSNPRNYVSSHYYVYGSICSENEILVVGYVLLRMSSIGLGIPLCCKYLLETSEILIAPKVYLLEYASQLIN